MAEQPNPQPQVVSVIPPLRFSIFGSEWDESVLIWFGIWGGFGSDLSVRSQVEKEVVVERQQEARRAPKLRYLDFVHVAAAQAAVCLAGLYGLAKDHAGPLRPGVDAVESTVKGVVGPVYDRFHGVPLDVLAFVDRKVISPPSHKTQTPRYFTPAVVRPATGLAVASRGSTAPWPPWSAPALIWGGFTPAAETTPAAVWRTVVLDGSVPPYRYFPFLAVHD